MQHVKDIDTGWSKNGYPDLFLR